MVPPASQNRHDAYRHPVYTTKRAQEQDGPLVVATPAYQTAYQSVRPVAIKQVLRRTLATLGTAVKRGQILADTEEVTGSNPVSPTSNIPSQPHFCACLRWDRVDLSAKLCRPIACRRLPSPPKILLMAAASSPAVEQLGGGHAFGVSATRHRHDR